MATSDLGLKKVELNESYDDIVIVNVLGDIPGGRTLDTSNLADDVAVIKAGNVIIKNDTTGVFSALPITDGAYNALPSGSSYVGVLRATILKKDARAAIVTMGQINAAASPAKVTDAIVTALPHIQFLYR